MSTKLLVPDHVQDAIATLQNKYRHALPWIPNFRTSKDGPEFTDDMDGPPFTIFHNGGPGGQIGSFDSLEDAEAVVAIINWSLGVE